MNIVEAYIQTKKQSRPNFRPAPGMRVKIREFSEMEKEFGLAPSGSIKCHLYFVPEMKKYCGKVATIKKISETGAVILDKNWGREHPNYSFSIDMIEEI